ncbi:NAC domain-containing protein JA2L [Linum perenne]
MNSSVTKDGKSGIVLVSSEETEVAKSFPVGYRFQPSDEELLKHYLMAKASGSDSVLLGCIGNTLSASEFFRFPPDVLVPAITRKNEWFLFIRQEMKHGDPDKPTATRTVGNGLGFWKSDESYETTICDSSNGSPLGSKSRFNYFSGSSSRSEKNDWKLDEYRLYGPHNVTGQEWALGRLTKVSDYE